MVGDEENLIIPNCHVRGPDSKLVPENANINNENSKKLQSLLTRAKAYSSFLTERLREQIDIDANCRTNQGNSKKRKQVDGQIKGFSQSKSFSGGILKGYQLEGVQWLVSLYENGLNGILADEMGLGKTIQCISLLAYLRDQGIQGPFLIVAPLSTIHNWHAEFKKFAPSIPVLTYYGAKEERLVMRRKHLKTVNFDLKNASVVITSYELAMKDSKSLAPVHWKYLVVDEGHRLKNLNCRLIKDLKSFKTDNRLLLTGTPLQNNLTELWSLLNFLLPDIFADVDEFLSWFDLPLENHNSSSDWGSLEVLQAMRIVEQLHLILKPLLLRRLKCDVERDLPPKREYIIFSALTALQKQYYQAVARGNLQEVMMMNNAEYCKGIKGGAKNIQSGIDFPDFENERSDTEEEGFSGSSSKGWPSYLHNKIMQLRKVCDHPYLFTFPVSRRTGGAIVDMRTISSSGKMQVLDQLLNRLRPQGHKVLIFSQMSRMLDILGDYLCIMRKEKYCRIDGSTPQADRRAQVKSFQSDNQYGIFLLSTRAGGLGLNLVAADTVIFYDSDWNPQMDLQAQDRVHRIGQTRPVLIYRLATDNTIESRILQRASSKRRLEKLVVHRSTLTIDSISYKVKHFLEKFKGKKQILDLNEDSLIESELKEILHEEINNFEHHTAGSSQLAKLTEEELGVVLDRSLDSYKTLNGNLHQDSRIKLLISDNSMGESFLLPGN